MFEFFIRRLPAAAQFPVGRRSRDGARLSRNAALHAAAHRLAASRPAASSTNLLDYLASFRFTGDVHAMPEGTVAFRTSHCCASPRRCRSAQLVESRIINVLHFQSLIASKAARMVLAANGKSLADFGLRSAHGAEAGLLAARASYIAGFARRGQCRGRHERFGIPVVGTMAHSFVQIHDDESDGIREFRARHGRTASILLIDTFDTEAGARKVVALAPRLQKRRHRHSRRAHRQRRPDRDVAQGAAHSR